MWRKFSWWVTLWLPITVLAADLRVQVLAPNAKPVSGMVVYLELSEKKPNESANSDVARTIEVLQHDKRFVPYLSVIRHNDQIVFRNRDNITHHIYSATGSARFSFTLRAGETHTVSGFTDSGIVAMGCNIHDWMSGYVLITDSGLFALSADDGWANFTALPAGKYSVHVWHPQMQEQPLPAQLDQRSGDTNLRFQLTKPLAEVPRQEALDDFDFLEGY